MPSPSSSKNNGSSSSGNSFADLADSIISAIETGFQSAGAQSQTGSAAGTPAGTAASGATSPITPPPSILPVPPPVSVIEPSGGMEGGGVPEGSHGEGPGEEGESGGEKAEHGEKKEGHKGRVKSAGEYFDRLKEGLWEEEVGVGYPALELATGVAKRINELDSGQYVSPEERQKSLAEATLPGAGGIAGAAIGTAFGNPVLGSFVGQGIGEVGASFIGAKSERDETTREAAEKLAAALGLAEASVHTFRAQIEATGAPVAQVAQGLSLLENTGVVGGSKAIAGQGALALGLGEQFGPVETTLTQTLSQNPALFRAADEFTQTGTMATGNFRDLAKYELLEGNLPAYTAAQEAASATRYTANPKIHQLEEDKATLESSPFMRVGNWAGGVLSGHNLDDEDSDQIDKLKEEDDKRREADDKEKGREQAEDHAVLLERGQARFDVIKSDSDANNLIMRYRYDANGNASPTDLAKRLPAIQASLEKNAEADQVMIEQDKKQLASAAANSPLRPAYELEISQLQDDQIQKRNIRYRELEHSNYLDQVKTSGAEFSLAETRAQIEGRSAGQIEQQSNRQASYLLGMAEAPNNPLSPEEAAGIEESALKVRYSSKIAAQRQSLDVRDERIEQAGLGVAQAQIAGGPDEVYQARSKEVEAFQAKISELSQELQKGGLSVDDRIAKERELTATLEASSKATFARDQGRFNDQFAVDSTLEETAQVGLSRRIGRSGNAGAGDAALGYSLDQITDAQSHLDFDRRNSPKNVKLIADDESRVATSREAWEQILDATNEYHPAGSISRKMANDRTDFQIALEAPYMDGSPESNPITRGNAVLGDIRQDLAGLESNRKRGLEQNKIHPGSWRDEDESRYTDQRNADRLQMSQIEEQQRMGFLAMLPEMIAGAGGEGVMSAVMPTSGQSGFYAGNPYVGGTFGQPHRTQTVDNSGHTPQAGGAAGAFLSASTSSSTLSPADVRALSSAINRFVDMTARGSAGGGRSPADYKDPNPANLINPYRTGGVY